MARSDERVRAATDALFPRTTTRRTSITDHAGWVAGRAAADVAVLSGPSQIADQAAS